MNTDPMTMAKIDGYIGAYSAKTWDELLVEHRKYMRDFYTQLPEQSTESGVTAELEHVLMMTGEAEASLDPTLSPSLNRVV
jgi:hypothetical protein